MDDTGATSRDTSRHVATAYDPLRHTLTVHEVELQLSAAGVGRTPRTIQRLCENKVFDAARLGGNNEWFVAPDSVPKVIADLRAHDDLRQRRVATLRDTSRHDAPEGGLNSANDVTRHDATRRDMSAAENLDIGGPSPNDTSRHDATQPDASRYVGQLEKRIEEKDQTIKFLQEELTDRRTQISGMKEIIDGQRGLLKQINEGFAPVFGALAQLVAPKQRDDSERVTATFVERPEGTKEATGNTTT
jgi:hypothetical protein